MKPAYPLNVALIGAHGTGKTTAARALSELTGLPIITERARTVARRWGLTPATIPDDRLVEYQEAILTEQIASEKALDESGFISDRSVIDNMAYLLANAGRLGIPFEVVSAYRRRAYQRLDKYDLLIVVPPMFEIVDDGERHVDPAFQGEIADLIDELLDDLSYYVCEGLLERVYRAKTQGDGRIAELAFEVGRRAGMKEVEHGGSVLRS